jgi:hypothetical protein
MLTPDQNEHSVQVCPVFLEWYEAMGDLAASLPEMRTGYTTTSRSHRGSVWSGDRAGLKGEPAGQLPGTPPKRHWNKSEIY